MSNDSNVVIARRIICRHPPALAPSGTDGSILFGNNRREAEGLTDKANLFLIVLDRVFASAATLKDVPISNNPHELAADPIGFKDTVNVAMLGPSEVFKC